MTAAVQSGEVKATRRGRLYIGPLSGGVSNSTGSVADARPSPTQRSTLLQAAVAVATGAATTPRLAVFSPTLKARGGTDDEAWNDVVQVWVDDAFDIQRRRGARPTTRDVADIEP
jgi:hypothetical protein